LRRNAEYFRAGLAKAGFALVPGEHPIIPVMIGDAAAAGRLAGELQQRGVYVTAFSYPVVPHGKARIRTQMNAAHSLADLDRAAAAFADAGRALGLVR
jgi:glycine C-acetyltransferase